MNGCLNLGPSKIGYHVHLVDHSTRVGVLLLAVLQRADESQPAQKSCPRLPHYVDSRFGPYHIAVVLSFIRSPAVQKFESCFLPANEEAASSESPSRAYFKLSSALCAYIRIYVYNTLINFRSFACMSIVSVCAH